MGTCRDRRGLVPSNYVKKLIPGLKCSYQTVCNTCCYINTTLNVIVDTGYLSVDTTVVHALNL